MGKSRILTGTVWHTEKFVRQEGDQRRHRSRCINYNSKTKYCSYMYGQCVGAAHCSHYKERVEPQSTSTVKPPEKPRKELPEVKQIPMSQGEINPDKAKKPGKEKVDSLIAYYKQSTADDRLHKVGTRVAHKTLGNGVVTASEGNRTTVKFESGKEMTFDIAMCIKKGFFTFRP